MKRKPKAYLGPDWWEYPPIWDEQGKKLEEEALLEEKKKNS